MKFAEQIHHKEEKEILPSAYIMYRKGNGRMKKRRKVWKAAAWAAAAGIGIGSFLAAPGSGMEAQAASAAPAYQSQWTAEYPFLTLLESSLLNSQTDAKGIYEQLKQAIKLKTLSEADIVQLASEGYRIPAQTLQQLCAEGWISPALYSMLVNHDYSMAQLRSVFDADYYVKANPVIAAAVQNGSLSSDEATLFLNYAACGIPAGLSASPDFSFTYFESAYPVVAEDLKHDRKAELLFYVTYKDSLKLKGNG